MKRIGLISDTHSYLHPDVKRFFKDCDEIWHAGDIGNTVLSDTLKNFKPLRAVYGNIDGKELRLEFPLHQRFECEGLDVWITHIGGYPGRYHKDIRHDLEKNPPGLFICGHSHILKVIYDKKNQLLHMNPGAAGKHGFHQKKTLLRFEISKGKVENLEIIELS